MKTGIVGCGGIAQVHGVCIAKIQGQALMAAADCRQERAVKMMEEYGIKNREGHAYESLEQMLDKERLDVLHICTPHYLHTPMAVMALEAGVNVFMEKPPVINFEQLELLKNAVKKAKNKAQLGLCFQNRYNASVKLVKELLLSMQYGKILGVRGIVNWSRSQEYYSGSDWRGKLATEGGGALINQSIHTLDLIQYLIDEEPLEIQAVMDNQHLIGKIEVEDTMAAYIRYPSVVANFYASTSYAGNVPPIVEVLCEKAMLRIEDNRVFIFHKNGPIEVKECVKPQVLGKNYWGASHENCIRDFYDAVERNVPFSLNFSNLKPTIELMLKAYESARGKQK